MNYALLRLLQLSDPALPVGGFSHSAGLETYVQMGMVKDLQSAREFIIQQLTRNILYTDAAYMSLAFDAATDLHLLLELDNECTAVKLPSELRMASHKMGGRLMKLGHTFSSSEHVIKFQKEISKKNTDGNYSIVFGLLAAVLKIEKMDALSGFLFAAASAMVTNAVKLVPLGQMAGQEMLYSLHEIIADLARISMAPNRDLTGLCCTGFDLRCMQHEDLYSRLYMS
jgi:urease accessory protein